MTLISTQKPLQPELKKQNHFKQNQAMETGLPSRLCGILKKLKKPSYGNWASVATVWHKDDAKKSKFLAAISGPNVTGYTQKEHEKVK